MREKSFSGRFIRPVATLLVVMTVSYVVYKSAWKVENHFLHQWLSHVFGLILFISLGFGALYVYRKTYFSGAGLGERILACLVCPFFLVHQGSHCPQPYLHPGRGPVFLYKPGQRPALFRGLG